MVAMAMTMTATVAMVLVSLTVAVVVVIVLLLVIVVAAAPHLMVGHAHTVVHPRTVVVHLHHAAVTHGTVVRPDGLESVAPLAVPPVLK